jgi:hypothetical protein
MGDAADDLTESGFEQLELHRNMECDESDCPYCIEEEIWDEEE